MMASNHVNSSLHSVQPLLEACTSSEQMKVSSPSASAASKPKRSQLGDDFTPSRFSVICGRGKDSYDHVGNHHFRELASMFVARYSRASSKADKSEIVSDMVGIIHQADGIFCKFEKGAWFKVGDHYAREKAGALLRDMVQTQQSSSSPSSSPPVVKAKQVKKAKKAEAKVVRPKIQKEMKTQNQQYGQQLIDATSGHSNDSTPIQVQAQDGHLLVEYDTPSYSEDVRDSEDSAPTLQCGEYELMIEDGNAGVWPSDAHESSVSTLSVSVEDLMGFDENWLEVEDDFLDIFRPECSIVGVPPSSLFNAPH
jgi:hypothetical protein